MAAVGTWDVFSLTYWARQRRGAALAKKVRANVGSVVKAKEHSKTMRLSCWEIERQFLRDTWSADSLLSCREVVELVEGVPAQ